MAAAALHWQVKRLELIRYCVRNTSPLQGVHLGLHVVELELDLIALYYQLDLLGPLKERYPLLREYYYKGVFGEEAYDIHDLAVELKDLVD